MTKTPKPQPGIMDIKLYESGASKVDGVDNVVKLSSNENPLGPSEKAIEAYGRSGHYLHRYPNTDHASLRFAIGEVHGLDPERIICGVGSDEIITFLCQAYAGPRDEVIYTEHGFSMYKISARAAGAKPVEVPERERVVDVDQILRAVTAKARIVFIANPANPTGTMVGQKELARLARELNLAFGKRKQGVVAANADALAWVFLRTALAHDDIARNDVLAAKFLDAKIFRV